MEAESSSEILVTVYEPTRRHMPEDLNLICPAILILVKIGQK
jgi:hypothetical protein